MSALIQINEVSIEVIAHGDTWAVSNKEVAESFGVTEATIRSQKSRGEFQEGIHFYVLQNATGNADQTMWTKKGVITLGFKLRETPKTIAFRDWASDFIITKQESVILPQITLSYEETMLNTLLMADSKVKELQQEKLLLQCKIENDKPKVSLAESIQVAAGSMNISDWVRVLKDESGSIKQAKVFNLLREWKILYKENKVNIPQAKYIDNGWFKVTETTIITPNGSKTKIQSKITGKGQVELSYRIKEYFKTQAESAQGLE